MTQILLIRIAELARCEGRPLRCLTLLAAGAELEKQTGMLMATQGPFEARIVNEGRASAWASAGEVAEAAWQAGSRMSLEEAVRYALSDEETPTVSAEPEVAEPASVTQGANTFRREGEYWALDFARQTVRLKDSKGLQDIARLLGCPGRGLAAVDLAAGAPRGTRLGIVGPPVAHEGWGPQGDVGPLVDAEARKQYRQRIADLEEELASAEATNDLERVSRGRQEREYLLSELGAAVGLGGRERRALDPTERARKAVTGRIMRDIARIEAVHPSLGRHLRRSIRTGAFCIYDPPAPTAWGL